MAITYVANGGMALNATTPSQNITSPTVSSGDYILIAVVLNKGLAAVISPPDGTWNLIVSGSTNVTGTSDDH